MGEKINLNEIIKEFGIDTSSTFPIAVPGLKSSTRIFEVRKPDLQKHLFIIDNRAGAEICSHPHLVGPELKRRCLECASEAIKAIYRLTDVRKYQLILLHLLRAGPAFRLREALQSQNKRFNVVEVWPKYMKPSYRAHAGERKIKIIYRNYENLPERSELCVIIPDTFATGRTLEVSIKDLLSHCRKVRSSIEEIILYGFISMPAWKTFKSLGIRTVGFSICGVYTLASNGYDMPFFGYDGDRGIGSIMDLSTLSHILPIYIPGIDAVGDWSERHEEIGDIEKHLRNSAEIIKNSLKSWRYKEWQKKIAFQKLDLIEKKLKKYL